MNTIIKPDSPQLDRLEQNRLKQEREQKDRSDYLESLKKSRKFKKYVVEEILEKVLNDTFTLDNLPVSDEMDKLGSVALQYVLARKAVKMVFDKLK